MSTFPNVKCAGCDYLGEFGCALTACRKDFGRVDNVSSDSMFITAKSAASITKKDDIVRVLGFVNQKIREAAEQGSVSFTYVFKYTAGLTLSDLADILRGYGYDVHFNDTSITISWARYVMADRADSPESLSALSNQKSDFSIIEHIKHLMSVAASRHLDKVVLEKEKLLRYDLQNIERYFLDLGYNVMSTDTELTISWQS